MGRGIALRNAAQQQDRLRENQFGNAARVRKRRIEYRNAALLGRCQFDLVSADAEATDAGQPRGILEKLASELCGRTYADKIRVRRGVHEFLRAQRLLVGLDIAVAVGPELLRGAGMDALQ